MDDTDDSSVTSEIEDGSYSDYNSESSYESYQSSEDSTDSESEEVIEQDPGKFEYPMYQLTMRHLHEHNTKYGKFGFWWKHGTQVYDGRRVYARLSQRIKKKCEELDMEKKECLKLRREIKYGYPGFSMKPHILRKLTISHNVVDSIRLQCLVGELKVPTWDEKCQELQTGLEKIISYLESDLNYDRLSENSLEYLNAFKYLCEERQKQIGYSTQVIQYGDPNQMTFQLAPWFRPESIRPYLNDYIPLNTTVDKDYFHREPAYEILTTEHCHEVFTDQLRPWINQDSAFETSLGSGETAWHVLEQDVIANDILTGNQLRVISQREKRFDLLDEKRMKNRRDELLSYFVDKYMKCKTVDIQRYKDWADHMKESESRFQCLLQEE